MKRGKLEKHLREHGCHFSHHGGKHDIWINPATGKDAPIPRHSEIKKVDCTGHLQSTRATTSARFLIEDELRSDILQQRR